MGSPRPMGKDAFPVSKRVGIRPPKQTVFSNELLMSQLVSQEALTMLLVEKGIFSNKGE